jgi:hypothetical protein
MRPMMRRRAPERGAKHRFKRYILERILRPPVVGEYYWMYFGSDSYLGSFWRIQAIVESPVEPEIKVVKDKAETHFPFLSLTRTFTFGEWYNWCR